MAIVLVTLGREDIVQQNILPDGQIEIKTITSIYDGDKLIARGNSRKVIEPGADISAEHAEVQIVASALHTGAVVEKFQLAKQARVDKELEAIKIK